MHTFAIVYSVIYDDLKCGRWRIAYLPFAIIHLRHFFDVRILLCVVITVPTVSTHILNKQLQATTLGQVCLLSCSDVKTNRQWLTRALVILPREVGARNWAACVEASDSLTVTSRLHSSNRTGCAAPNST